MKPTLNDDILKAGQIRSTDGQLHSLCLKEDFNGHTVCLGYKQVIKSLFWDTLWYSLVFIPMDKCDNLGEASQGIIMMQY